MTKKQKTVLWIGTAIAGTLLTVVLLAGEIAPAILRSYCKLSYRDKIGSYSREYRLDPYFVCGVIFTESKFDPNAKSRVGASGLMQVMPATGAEIARQLDLPYSDEMLFDPETSIRFGTFYLRQQMDAFDNNPAVVLAAYNAGPYRAEQWLSQYGLDSEGKICYIPFQETDQYVDRVLLMQKVYRILYPKAFEIDS